MHMSITHLHIDAAVYWVIISSHWFCLLECPRITGIPPVPKKTTENASQSALERNNEEIYNGDGLAKCKESALHTRDNLFYNYSYEVHWTAPRDANDL